MVSMMLRAVNTTLYVTDVQITGSEAIRKMTRREHRRFMQQAVVDFTVIRSALQPDVGLPVVAQTISIRLLEANLALLVYCLFHQNTSDFIYSGAKSNITDRKNVAFREQSLFVLGADINGVRICKCSSE
ncbi:hypothetical protein TNCV_3394441 [Trichonephila clavipes]|nr:hypothetical protein TNCV_3394441 [Trichonephila clavipes]